jgi:hypothetical protein
MLTTQNKRAILVTTLLVISFSLIKFLPSSFYNTGVYSELWTGITNILLYIFLIFSAGWLILNVRDKNWMMFYTGFIIILLVTFSFFDVFTTDRDCSGYHPLGGARSAPP